MKKQHQLILSTARQMGIEVKDLSTQMGCDAARLTKGNKKELIVKGTPTSLISLRSLLYCDNKQLTKEVYQGVNVPFPKSISFRSIDDPNISSFLEEGKTYVAKPTDAANGVGVVLNIKNQEDLTKYWEKCGTLTETFMLEEQIEGTDLRVQVIDGEIIAAGTRIPASVKGDGERTLSQLIEELQVRTSANNPANNFVVDDATQELMQQQNITFSDIPQPDQTIQLKRVANMAQGAICVDLTDELDPIFQKWIDRLCDYLGVDFFAIDIIAGDHQHYTPGSAWVLEINAQPEWLHHTFSERKKHDMATILLEYLFKDNSRK